MTDMLPTGAPAPGTYTLDPERTTIRADVKAMFGLMTVHGTFRLQSGAGQHRRLSDVREEAGGARFRATAGWTAPASG